MAEYARSRFSRQRYSPDNFGNAQLARDFPGRFAGIYFGTVAPPYLAPTRAERKLVLLLADTTNLTRTLAALDPHFAQDMAQRGFRLRDAVVRKARWDFSQLFDWQRVLLPILTQAAGSGVSTASVSVPANRVSFGVVDSATKRLVESRLAGLGLPCDLVEIEVVGRGRPTVTTPGKLDGTAPSTFHPPDGLGRKLPRQIARQ